MTEDTTPTNPSTAQPQAKSIDELFREFQDNLGHTGEEYKSLSTFHKAESLATSQEEKNALYGSAVLALARFHDQLSEQKGSSRSQEAVGHAFAKYLASKISYAKDLVNAHNIRYDKD